MNPKKLPVLCIVGPTASGKSDLGIRIAEAVGGEVLSADSMQVYKGMDIGTAKLTPQEMRGVPHHLLDLVTPDQPFTVADWVRHADNAIHTLHERGKLPVVVGGTGLYIRGITEDLDFANRPGSEEARKRWNTFLEQHGREALHKELAARDPETAARLHQNDVRRVIRALEVVEQDGQKMSETYDWQVKGGRYHTVEYALTMDREALYRRIETRIDKMVEEGLPDEVKGLLDAGYHRWLTAMQGIGYKEVAAALDGEFTMDEAILAVKQNTRRFAKRQLSWFRRDSRIRWLEVDQASGVSPDAFEEVLKTAYVLKEGIQGLDRE